MRRISKEFEKIMNIAWDIENGSEDQKAPVSVRVMKPAAQAD